MRSKNHQPNAVEKRWREDVRELGSIISGQKPCVIHHCAGASAKSNKVAIGHFWLLPLTETEHAKMHANAGRKDREKTLFTQLCARYVRVYGRDLPFGADVMESILDYHR